VLVHLDPGDLYVAVAEQFHRTPVDRASPGIADGPVDDVPDGVSCPDVHTETNYVRTLDDVQSMASHLHPTTTSHG
jgi:hypothetical protein